MYQLVENGKARTDITGKLVAQGIQWNYTSGSNHYYFWLLNKPV
jgi:hypothetical protein